MRSCSCAYARQSMKQHIHDQPSGKALTLKERLSYVALVVLSPLLGGPLAVNGSAVFQIIAIEELGLSSRQVGLAIGLGALSIPFQVMATRVPLQLAHRNLRLYLVAMSAMCLVMAWLVAGPGSSALVTASVIFIAIIAELAVSILFATSFQPLLATTVAPQFRQQLNAQGRAGSGLLAISFVILIAWASTNGRVAILIALAVMGALLLPAVSGLRQPTLDDRELPASQSSPAEASDLRWILAAIGISVAPAWGFFVTYAADAYWPAAHLGLVGAAIVAGSLVAQALWRATTRALLPRARFGAVLMLFCACALPFISPSSGVLSEVTVYGILAAAMAAGTVVRMSLLEMTHLRSDAATSVAVLTRLDVIASTSMQLGFLAAGFLIERSVGSSWIADPFQLSLIIGGVALVAAVEQIPSR